MGFREVLLSKAQEQFNKFKVINSKDKNNFAEGSLERRRLEVEEKINALPAPTDNDVCKNKKWQIMIIFSSTIFRKLNSTKSTTSSTIGSRSAELVLPSKINYFVQILTSI